MKVSKAMAAVVGSNLSNNNEPVPLPLLRIVVAIDSLLELKEILGAVLGLAWCES